MPAMAETAPPRETATHYRSMRDWVDSQGETGAYNVIFPAETLHSPRPKGLEEDVDVFESFLTLNVPEAYVAVVPGGRLCGDHVNSAVVAPNGKLIWDVSFGHEKEPDEHWLFNGAQLPAPISTSETVAPLTIRPLWSGTYYHWMFEVLPRIELLRRSGLEIDRYVTHPLQLRFQSETIDALGIRARVIESAGPFHIEAERLAVPSLVPSVAPSWACQFLRREFLTPGRPEGRTRLYVSRATAARGRHVRNEEQVADTLVRLGFDVVALDSLSVAEQVRLFRSAECVVGAHGAALTNLVFCDPGTKVIELFAPRYVHPIYWLLSTHCALDYHYLIGRGKRARTWATWPTGGGGLDPIDVDLDELGALLAIAGISGRR
jgi:hypothetical protein